MQPRSIELPADDALALVALMALLFQAAIGFANFGTFLGWEPRCRVAGRRADSLCSSTLALCATDENLDRRTARRDERSHCPAAER